MASDSRGNIEQENLQSYLDKETGEGKTKVMEYQQDKYVKFNDTNRFYKVDIDGNIERLEEIMIGLIYDENSIGEEIEYNPDENLSEDNSWIIFFFFEDGNILITTKKPIENKYQYIGNSSTWLNHEELLNEICSIYGKDSLTARSITIDDINKTTGFMELTFNEYIFNSRN